MIIVLEIDNGDGSHTLLFYSGEDAGDVALSAIVQTERAPDEALLGYGLGRNRPWHSLPLLGPGKRIAPVVPVAGGVLS